MQRMHRMFRRSAAGFAGIALATLAAGCGGGGGGGSDPEVGANALYVVDMDTDGLDGVSLNQPFTLEFSEWLRAETVRHDTIQIRVGPRFGIQSFGDFKVSGDRVTFYPQLPTLADLSDAGFQPQSQYRVTVLGSPSVNRVNSYSSRPLVRTFTGTFSTAASTSPDLFTTDTYADAPPPTVLTSNPPDVLPTSLSWDPDGNGVYDALAATPGGAQNVPTDASIVVQFNRVPLRPETITTTNVSLMMVDRLGVIQQRPIQGTPVVEQTFEGTRLLFVPAFPLADQARYVLRIENRVTDLTGQYDVADNSKRALLRSQAESGVDPALTAYAQDPRFEDEFDPRTYLIFTTRDEPTKDLTLVLNFDGTDLDQDGGEGVDLDRTTASFNDAVPGAVAAQFTAAGGDGTLGDFTPTSNTTLSTNSPSAVNGQFNFQRIDIPSNVTVTITGTLPATLLALKPVTIAGVLGATGEKGENGETSYNTTSLPQTVGGAGGPGGGDGGDNYVGSDNEGKRGYSGENGPNGGGGGGQGGLEPSTQATAYGFGGGGGGGAHQYDGDKGENGNYTSYSSWNGNGGNGGTAGGIQPTSANTDDGKTFWQEGVGAGGGGGGGNAHYVPNSTNWRNAAGAGGGGGGALLVKGAGDITVSGSIIAKGGDGGTSNSYYYSGAGGGAGGGGTIALYASLVLDISNATLDTSGGTGGARYSSGWSGRGGDGGGGYVQLEDEDGSITGSAGANILPDFYTASFSPTGTASDAPSIFTSSWMNMGVFDPAIQNWTPQDFLEQNFSGATIEYQIQMAIENGQDFGRADTTSIDTLTGNSSDYAKASDWQTFKDATNTIQNGAIASLNGKGYQFFRVRMYFTLPDGQKRDDPVPYVSQLKIRVKY